MSLGSHVLRGTLVWLAGTAVGVLAVAALRAEALALAQGPGTDVAQALVRVASAVLLGCAAWAWAATTSVVLQVLRGRSARPVRGVPAPMRRLLLVACGATLTAGLAGPATADPGLAGLPLPDRAVGGATIPTRSEPPPATVVVRAGDSLWALAERDLGPAASPAEVARHARRLHRLNRAVVGPDPDLIHPGQQLRLPPPPQETS